MGKEADLYMTYLKLARTLAKNKALVPLLMPLDYHH